MPDANDEPPIHEFARDGDTVGVLTELGNGTPVDARHPVTDRTPLIEAAASARAGADLVRLLIQKGANVNAHAADKHFANAINVINDVARLNISADGCPVHLPALEAIKETLEKFKRIGIDSTGTIIRENPLSLAVGGGNLEKVETLLNAGADIHYMRAHDYDVLIDALHGRPIASDSHLLPILQLLIGRGAWLNTISRYGESAIRVASYGGRFDAVKLLLSAGGDPAPLQWTPLMHAIAVGSLEEVRALLERGSDLSARDSWSRTPLLLCLQAGDIDKAKLLLSAGASRSDRGNCGKPPLAHPIVNDRAPMLRWLLSEGFNPNDVDDFKATPLIEAAEAGATQCVRALLEVGADAHRINNSGGSAIKLAANLEIVRLLLEHGADLNDIGEEMRAAITRLPCDGRINVSRDEFLAAAHRRFGSSNPKKMNLPFWNSMVTSGAIAYAAGKKFKDAASGGKPIWCFHRFGKSISELPDGRIVEIGGEHEDYYDDDFCIYNDVVVHHGDGTFDIFGYPKECFPPTDFHTATLVGSYLYIIGSLGYHGERAYGETQVCRLDTRSFEIERINTFGDKPGWIHKHKATYQEDEGIRISGGKICLLEAGEEHSVDNSSGYVLDLSTLVWRKR